MLLYKIIKVKNTLSECDNAYIIILDKSVLNIYIYIYIYIPNLASYIIRKSLQYTINE